MPEPIPKLPVQLVQHVAGRRHVTTFEPAKAVASMKVRGFELVGWSRELDAVFGPIPIFARLAGPRIEENIVFEEPA